MESLTRQIYDLLVERQRVTAAGVCHLLRDMELPPVMQEAERSLDWLRRNGYANAYADQGFGVEYAPKER